MTNVKNGPTLSLRSYKMSFSNFAVTGAKPVLEAYSDGYFKKGQFVRNQGMHWVLAGLFCVGDMAGAGIVALPTAMIQSRKYHFIVWNWSRPSTIKLGKGSVQSSGLDLLSAA